MKREGKQHGMVRTYRILPNPKPNTRFVTRLDSPPTAGLFAKVPSKPTNHSKFTGKCNKARCSDCRLHPVSKSKNKSKGSFKHFQVMDQPGLKFRGLSATGTLNHLSNCYMDDDDDVEDENVVDHVDDVKDESVVDHVDDDHVKDESVVEHVDDVEDKSIVDHVDNDDEVEDANNSCILEEKEVEYPLRVEQVKEEKYEDEDWCWVEVECCS
ncbi:uncharacterized protein LOC131635954 [Vicia villosa]|uniref:uncharacterized protein LOC131635954 n=1 Tax=Vicia villosa TaxID=3911 RepID=UPI00273C8703|nr:uncharacterized protein LOC131635954 [Vicia villosa]